MREINFEDPTNLFFVRVAFGSVAALSAMTLYYMYTRIQSKADSQRKITVPPPATPSWGAAAEYAPPAHATAITACTRSLFLYLFMFLCPHIICSVVNVVCVVVSRACACACQGPSRRRR